MELTRHKCTDCGKEFSTIYEYYRHRTTAHSGARQQGANPRREELEGGQSKEELTNRENKSAVPGLTRHKCTDCGKEFSTIYEYYRHRTTAHSGARQQGAKPKREELEGGQSKEELTNRENNPAVPGLELEFLACQYAAQNTQNANKNFKARKAIQVWQDFAENTTLHGIKYFTKRVSTVEKIFWIVNFMTSITLCAFLIYSVWFKWRYTPVIVAINDKLVSVGETSLQNDWGMRKRFMYSRLTRHKCTDCGKEFSTIYEYYRHRTTAHSGARQQGANPRREELEGGQSKEELTNRENKSAVPGLTRHKCTDCGKEFSTIYEYYRHRTTAHSGARQQGAKPKREELEGGQSKEELTNRENNPAVPGLELEFLACQYAAQNTQNANKNFKARKAIQVWQDFAENTTLHGIKYFTKRVSTVEKIFWIVNFMTSITLCAFLIYSVWFKWRYTPVIVAINDKLVSVGEVPFPSVTICQSFNCDETGFEYSEYWNATDKLKMNLPTLCKWRGQNTSCEEIFKTVFTREGKCYNFNGLAHFEILDSEMKKEHLYNTADTQSLHWTPYGYSSEGPVYPRRGQGCGLNPDLDIELDRDNGCKNKNTTFKIYLRHPTTAVPQTSKDYYTAVLGELTTLALGYKVLNTTENLIDFSADVRQCYFPGERKLRYFKIYSPENCELECISNITYSDCNCVMMYMPHGFTVPPVCKSESLNCTIEAQERFAVESSRGINSGRCKCFPSCLSIDYEAEVTKSYLDSQKASRPNRDRYAKIQMYFKESRVMSMRRWDLGLREYGLVDFLANCGGLLGLFLGFSSLSLVEIFYYLTLRIWCAIKDTAPE